MRITKPRTQRRLRMKAPMHLRQHFLHAHLSKELRAQLKKRAIRLRKGDKVKILRGSFKGKEGKIIDVDLTKGKIKIEGITHRKARGQEVLMPIDPSNVIIIETTERN
ncbi:MAG: 50S ribosomal protein L24 [Candidatus Micrarchaeia archaeon]